MKKLMLFSLAVVLILSVAVGCTASAPTAPTAPAPVIEHYRAATPTIIESYGKGFLEEKEGMLVLHVRGTPYEMGYQHGVLLADKVFDAVTRGITLCALQLGGGDFQKGLQVLKDDSSMMERYLPPQHKKELQGMVDGLAAKGYDLTYDDLVIWNTAIDIAFGERTFAKGFGDRSEQAEKIPYPEIPYPACSGIAAWGEATLDGRLIYGSNCDYEGYSAYTENAFTIVVEPDEGYAFIGPCVAGWLNAFSGLNEAGIAYRLIASPTSYATLQGQSIQSISRVILQYTGSIDDAVQTLTLAPRTFGLGYVVVDGDACQAAVIETSPAEIAVRYPEPGKDVIYHASMMMCYPGWHGYTGYNMVTAQAAYSGWKDVSTVEKWRASLGAAWRGFRIEQLLDEYYGEITTERMIAIQSDRYHLVEGRDLGWEPYKVASETICWFGQEKVIAEDAPYYKSDKHGPVTSRSMGLLCLVTTPATGDIRIALGSYPAQRGRWVHFNLNEELLK